MYPHIGVIGYLGFVLLMPEWNWRWSLPLDFQYQKFIVIFTLLGFILHGMKGNPFSGHALTACCCLIGFLGLAYVSSLFTINEIATNFYMDILWKVVLMSLLTYRLIDTPGRLMACLWVMVIAQGYNALRINEQYFIDGYSLYALRPWGESGDNNLYSLVTVPLIAMSGALVVYSPRWWQKCISGGIFVLQMHQIMLLESRGAMLGCLFLAGLFVCLMPKNRFTLTALSLAVVMGAALAGPPVIREFSSSFKTAEVRDSSAESRFTLWKAGAAITANHPVLGVGPYAGQFLVPQYAPQISEGDRKGLHNLIFEISTGCGIPATLLYVIFFLIPGVAAFKQMFVRGSQLPDWAAMTFLTVAAGLPGYWLASMFSSGALLQSSYAVAGLGLAALSILQRMPTENLDDLDDMELDGQDHLWRPDDEELVARTD